MDIRNKIEAIAYALNRPNYAPYAETPHEVAEHVRFLLGQLAQLSLERDQLREQCAYNQLTIDALTAGLAKADRMDQQ